MLCNSSRTWWSFFFKLIVITGIFSIFFTRFTTQIEAKEYSINSLLIEAIIRPDGSMEVTEKRLYDFRDDFAFAYQYLYHHSPFLFSFNSILLISNNLKNSIILPLSKIKCVELIFFKIPNLILG